MCGHRRSQVPAFCPNYNYGYAHGFGGGRRCSGYSRRQHSVGPIGAAVAGITFLVNAANERSIDRNDRLPDAGQRADVRSEQVTGVVRSNNITRESPAGPYPNDKGGYAMEGEKQTGVTNDPDEEPPAYSPYASAREATVVPNTTKTTAPVPAAAGLSSTIHSVNNTFAALPILQHHSREQVIQADIENLSNAIAAVRIGDCRGKCAARNAGRQLIRDLWEAEVGDQGRNMLKKESGVGCQERKALKRENRDVKKAVRAEMKEVKREVRRIIRTEIRA